MIISLLVVTFFVTVLTGPAFDEWRRARRERVDSPSAKVVYLPSARCWRSAAIRQSCAENEESGKGFDGETG